MNEELGAAPTTKLHRPRTEQVPKLRQPAKGEGRWPECERGRDRAQQRWWTRSSGWLTSKATRSPQPDSCTLGLGSGVSIRRDLGELQDGCWGFGKRHADCVGQRLTCELSGHRQRGARPVRQMINNTAARAWRHAVGAPLERGVRPRYFANGCVHHCCSQGVPSRLPSIFTPGQLAKKNFASLHERICEQCVRPSQRWAEC